VQKWHIQNSVCVLFLAHFYTRADQKNHPVRIAKKAFFLGEKLQNSPYFEGKKVTCRHI
jgi:hypothetical protein